MNFTDENKQTLIEYLNTHDLPTGLGTKESACSIAAINLAISGKLTDSIPDCMSTVLGRITIKLQDVMPHEMRNSKRYKDLLPHMAGTGRGHEQERKDIILDWMWTKVLPSIQHIADVNGFGDKWKLMCSEKTRSAAAHAATYAAAYADAATHADAANSVYAAADAAYAAVHAVHAVHAANTDNAADADFWKAIDPISMLENATFIGESK